MLAWTAAALAVAVGQVVRVFIGICTEKPGMSVIRTPRLSDNVQEFV